MFQQKKQHVDEIILTMFIPVHRELIIYSPHHSMHISHKISYKREVTVTSSDKKC